MYELYETAQDGDQDNIKEFHAGDREKDRDYLTPVKNNIQKYNHGERHQIHNQSQQVKKNQHHTAKQQVEDGGMHEDDDGHDH